MPSVRLYQIAGVMATKVGCQPRKREPDVGDQPDALTRQPWTAA